MHPRVTARVGHRANRISALADLNSSVALCTSSTKKPATGPGREVPVDITAGSEDLDLAPVMSVHKDSEALPDGQ
jgi:hypothetical protein